MKYPRRRAAAFAAPLLAIALVTTACSSSSDKAGGDADAGTPVKGGTLNMLGIGDVDFVDPNVTYYSAGYTLSRLYSRQLVTFPAIPGKTTEVAPDLATELPTVENGGISADGKTYTFHLRDGVKWDTSPARAVTAQDFVRGVKRTCNPFQPFGASTYFTTLIQGMQKFCDDFAKPYNRDAKGEFVNAPTAPAIAKYINDTDLPGVVATDDSTIQIKLNNPASYFVDMLALNAFSPAPVEVMKYLPGSAELGKNQVSDGPYSISKYDPTKSIELERNPAWDAATDPIRKAYVDKVVISENGDQGQIQRQLQTSSAAADMEWDTFPTAEQVPALAKAKDPNLSITPTSSSNPFIIYNFVSPNNGGAMAKLPFRQALSYATNRDNIIQVLGGPRLNEPLTQVLPSTIVGGETKNDPYPYDLQKAKDLIAQSGVSNPTLKVLYRNASNGSTKTFETLQQDLGKVGIKVVGVQSSNGDFLSKYLTDPKNAKAGVFDLAIAGWGPDWYGNAALSYFGPLYSGTPAFPPAGSNYGFYDNSKTNTLIQQASEASEDQAGALWAQADKQVMADAAFYPITAPKTANYKASHVHNAVPMEVFQNFDPANVWISKNKQN
ncbi:MAG: transporter substrate-binding protein [Marmoricola sp.]|nr:transporter substrate-binding protein [Marmoricola sp.]